MKVPDTDTLPGTEEQVCRHGFGQPTSPSGTNMSFELIHSLIVVAFLGVCIMVGDILVRKRRVEMGFVIRPDGPHADSALHGHELRFSDP